MRSNRSKECFILWNSKLEFLKEAIDLNPFGSDKFVWNDIGNVRNPFIKEVISAYPKSVCVSEDKVDITVIRNPGLSAAMLEKIHVYRSSGGNVPCFQNEILLSGSIFGSSAETLLKFHTAFYKMFDYYLSENKFIGCDQQIMASILLTNPELFNLIDPYKVGLPKGVDPWFSLQFFYISA